MHTYHTLHAACLLSSYCPATGSSRPGPGTTISADVFDPDVLVEFHFTNSEVTDVIHHLARLTGWSVFYDPAQVRGKVTIITPGKVPLAQAVRLLQGVTRPYGHAIQVLTPHSPQAVPLAAVLTTLAPPPEQRDAVVWRSSNARGPQSRPTPVSRRAIAPPGRRSGWMLSSINAARDLPRVCRSLFTPRQGIEDPGIQHCSGRWVCLL